MANRKFKKEFKNIDELSQYLQGPYLSKDKNKEICIDNKRYILVFNSEKVVFRTKKDSPKNYIFYLDTKPESFNIENKKLNNCIFINYRFYQQTLTLNKENFEGKIEFYDCDFDDKVTIEDQILNSLVFEKCNFKQRVKCNGSTFGSLVFAGCTFDEYLDLSKIHFKEKLALEFSRVKDLFFNYIDYKENKENKENKKKSNFKNFSLKGIAVEKYIFYEETKIEHAANHQTFTILKHNAIKLNDNIRAIEFHRQEMDKYKKELKNSADRMILCLNFTLVFTVTYSITLSITLSLALSLAHAYTFKKRIEESLDYLILFSEKAVSNYGTSFMRVIFGFAALNWFFYFHCPLVWSLMEWLDNSFLKVIITYFRYFAGVLTPFKENIGIRGFFQLVINAYLIYELQKSLRKFSRKF